jgi:dihydrofolate reductase
MSLDGYIAGPKGEADWIIMDPDIDFSSLFNEFDTVLMGRRTFEAMLRANNGTMLPGMKAFVFSSTLQQGDYPNVTIVAEKTEETLATIRAKPGKDIWLFGGGLLFRSLLAAGCVNTIEIAVVPVLLGGGIPLLPPPANQVKLQLTGHTVYKTTGIVSLQYALQ